LKYRLSSVTDEGENSRFCDIEHTVFDWKPLCEKNSPARSTHRRRAQLSAFKTHCGDDT